VTQEVPVHGTCHPRFAKVREIFTRGFENGSQLGASVCFTLDGEPVVDLWGGWLDFDKGREWERDTLVNVYSTTKGMTALCAHQLVEQGKLDLHAPVAHYWPEFAAAGKGNIPVRWLLSHQAGLSAPRRRVSAEELYAWDPIVEALAESEPWWEPGTRHGYHAMTFGHLVGELIRRVSGKSVGTWFRENVAEPLDADFHIGLAEEDEARTSDLHGSLMPPDSARTRELPEPFATFMRDMRDPTTLTGAAFATADLGDDAVNGRAWRAAEIPAANGHGTAAALARIYGALARGGEVDGVRILESETLERAIEEQAHGPDAVLGGMPVRFGLGFMLCHDFMPLSPNPRSFGHPGAGGSIGMADPDAGVGFGFTLNKMQMGLMGAAGGFAMLQAFFDEL
jgi:CubicO group peptidase (beta-lactamase class C family)